MYYWQKKRNDSTSAIIQRRRSPEQWKEKIELAENSAISNIGKQKLEQLWHNFPDALRPRLGNDPPENLSAINMELKNASSRFAAGPRRCLTEGRKWMEKYSDWLLEYSFGKVNTEGNSIAAPVLVLKSGLAQFRLDFDSRQIKEATEPMHGRMPHLDSEISDFARSNYFATLAFLSGYSQLPFHTDFQNQSCFMTNNRVITRSRTTQGARNPAGIFQA